MSGFTLEQRIFIFPASKISLHQLNPQNRSPVGAPLSTGLLSSSNTLPNHGSSPNVSEDFFVVRGGANSPETLRCFGNLLTRLTGSESNPPDEATIRIALEYCGLILFHPNLLDSLKMVVVNIILNIVNTAVLNPAAGSHFVDWIDEIVGFRRLLDWMMDSEMQIVFLLTLLFAHLTQLEALHDKLMAHDIIHILLHVLTFNHEGNVAQKLQRDDVQQKLAFLASSSTQQSTRNDAKNALMRIKRSLNPVKKIVTVYSERSLSDLNPMSKSRETTPSPSPTSPPPLQLSMPKSLARLFLSPISTQPPSPRDGEGQGDSPRSNGSAGSSSSRDRKSSLVKSLTISTISRPEGPIGKKRSLVRQACLSLGDKASIKKLLDLISFEYDDKLEKILKEESIIKSLLISLGRKESHKPKLLRTLRLLASKNDHFLNDVLTSGGSLLARLALGADSRVSQEALSCILGITKTPEDQDRFRSLGLVSGLVQGIYHDKDASSCVIRLELLCRLVHSNQQSQAEAFKNGALDAIKKVLPRDDIVIKSKALRAVSGLVVENVHLQNEAREAGIIQDVVQVLKLLQDNKSDRSPSEQQLLRNALFALSDIVRGNVKSQKLAKTLGSISIVVNFLSIRSTIRRSSDMSFAERAALSFTSAESHSQWSAAAFAIHCLIHQSTKNQKELKESAGLLHLLNAISSSKTILVSTEFAQGRYDGVHTSKGLNHLIQQCLKTLIEACSSLESCMAEVIGPALLDAAKTLLNRDDVSNGVKENFVLLLLHAVQRKDRWRDLVASELGDCVGVLYADTRDHHLTNLCCQLIVAFAGSNPSFESVQTQVGQNKRTQLPGNVPQTA